MRQDKLVACREVMDMSCTKLAICFLVEVFCQT
jgi:hypothetical protein